MTETNKTHINIAGYIKSSVLFTVIAIVLSLLLVLITSIAMSKMQRYEISYPIIELIFGCFPSFLSARFAIKKYRRSLLINAVMQALFVSLLLFIATLTLYGSMTSLHDLLKTLPVSLAGAVFAAFLPITNRKKIKHI